MSISFLSRLQIKNCFRATIFTYTYERDSNTSFLNLYYVKSRVHGKNNANLGKYIRVYYKHGERDVLLNNF